MLQVARRTSFNWWNCILYVGFLFSGFSALAYQVVWTREFGLIFGVTSYAVSTVLAAFFAGLALGSWLASRLLRRLKGNPLRVYAMLESGIAVYALAVPFLLDGLNAFYAVVFPLTDGSFYLLSLIRFVCSVLVLLIPTTLMGATLPMITETLATRTSNVTANVSNIYAWNTLGAFTGAAFSGFYAIGAFGMQTTMLIGVVANLLSALSALLLSRSVESGPIPVRTESRPATAIATNPQHRRLVLVGLFLSGFTALGYEVIWTRILSMLLGRTVVAFTTILCSVLLGIVIGSWLLRVFEAQIKRPLRLLFVLELGVAWINLCAIVFVANIAPGRDSLVMALSLGLVMVVPNALLGATLPLAVRIYQEQFQRVGQSVGEIYAANVLGGVLGAFAVSFMLIPLLGSQQTVVLLAALNAGIAWLFFHAHRSSAQTPAHAGSLVWLGATALGVGFFVVQPTFMFDGMSRSIYRNQSVILQDERVEGVVTVTERDNIRSLYLNGALESNDYPGLLTIHRRLAHLPLLLHTSPKDVLVIGLGSGTTAGTVTRHPVNEILIVELVPGMFEGARLFRQSNYDLLNQANIRLQVDDGRNFLKLNDRKFDVILADVIVPTRAGANNLYAADYYRLVASRLKPGGVVCQWLDTRLPEEEYKLLLRTFTEVFPNATLWHNGSYVVAMPDGVKIDADLLRQRFSDPNLAPALGEGGYANLDTLLDTFVMGPESIRRYVGAGPILTDNNPYLEYMAPALGSGSIQLTREDVRAYLSKVGAR